MADDKKPPEQGNDKPKPDWNDRVYVWIAARPLAALLLAGGGVAVLVVVYWAFRPDVAPAGAGFAYTVPQSGDALKRTLWDWLGLLIVPLAVAAGAAFIGFVQKRTELEIAKRAREEDRELAAKARETEQRIADDRLRQVTLETYYDRMTELLLGQGLRASAAESEVIARARTVAVVKGLDAERNRQLFAFLKASRLFEKGPWIIDLHGADFRRANLSRVNLSGVNLGDASLSGADLSGANLSEAYLIEADLSGANLSKANLILAVLKWAELRGARLHGANLGGADLREAKGWTIDQLDQAFAREGTTMPDGVKLKHATHRDAPTYDEWKAGKN